MTASTDVAIEKKKKKTFKNSEDPHFLEWANASGQDIILSYNIT